MTKMYTHAQLCLFYKTPKYMYIRYACVSGQLIVKSWSSRS